MFEISARVGPWDTYQLHHYQACSFSILRIEQVELLNFCDDYFVLSIFRNLGSCGHHMDNWCTKNYSKMRKILEINGIM